MEPFRTLTVMNTNGLGKREDLFRFNKNRKHQWLQKIVFWILSKLDCYYVEPLIQFKQIRIDSHDFVSKLFKQYEEVSRVLHCRPEKIYIGPKQMLELSGNTDYCRILRFSVPVVHNSTRHREILGMEIVVVPWLDGIFIPPESLRH